MPHNTAADLPVPPPPLHPGTPRPVGADDLSPLLPMDVILREVSAAREIATPEPPRGAINAAIKAKEDGARLEGLPRIATE
ncbi:MAG: hypothetical protein IOC82_13650 [Aestuariivirga sp.]|uniref:hypothetical protein n=1 Tax=Aestuariivirga sp. TaxID=2650926 RepID=UPI0025C07CCF|nr:hypothetical protein [Aestuariivirga sp.]MCA3562063.1 hypothetical protein [Aestuariivirga sp.]